MARGVKRRSSEDWSDEVRRLHRMRVAADLEVKAGDRSPEWGACVEGAVDALSLLIVTSSAGEQDAVTTAAGRMGRLAAAVQSAGGGR